MKKTLSVILSAIMLLTSAFCVPVVSFADEGSAVSEGVSFKVDMHYEEGVSENPEVTSGFTFTPEVDEYYKIEIDNSAFTCEVKFGEDETASKETDKYYLFSKDTAYTLNFTYTDSESFTEYKATAEKGSEYNESANVTIVKATDSYIDNIIFTVLNGNMCFLGYKGEDESLIIPDTILEMPVKELYMEAQTGNAKNIVVPKSVEVIGLGALGNKNIKTVTIKNPEVEFSNTYPKYLLDQIKQFVDIEKIIDLPEDGKPWYSINELIAKITEIFDGAAEGDGFEAFLNVYGGLIGVSLTKEEFIEIYKSATGVSDEDEKIVMHDVNPEATVYAEHSSTAHNYANNNAIKFIGTDAHTPAEAVKENEKPSTCSKNGSYNLVTYCSECSAKIDIEAFETDLSEHTPAEAVIENEKAASCAEKGSYDMVVYCSVCGEELGRETIETELAEHTPAEAVKENEKAASCTEEGAYDEVIYCAVCGEELSREAKTEPMLSHNFENGAKACSVCGAENPDYVKPEEPTKPTEPAKPTEPTTVKPESTEINLAKVVFKKLKKGKKSFKAIWKAVKGADGYEVQYSLKKNMKKAKMKDTEKTKLTVKKLKSKKKYYVRIRAYKIVDGSKVYGKWSKKKAVKIK